MSTRAELLLGADFEGNEAFCDTVVNALKNHWRVSNPCVNMTERRPGEILSDPDDDKLYHVGGDSGYPCDEILQENRSPDAEPVFNTVELGNNNIRTDSRARAYLGTDQLNIADATYTQVLIDTENYDSGNNFNIGTYEFVAPVTGFYLAIGQITYKAVIADKRYLAILRTSVPAYIAISSNQSSHTDWVVTVVSDVVYLVAAQTLRLYCYHNAGVGTVDIQSGTQYTFFNIHLLSI